MAETQIMKLYQKNLSNICFEEYFLYNQCIYQKIFSITQVFANFGKKNFVQIFFSKKKYIFL